MFEFMRLRALRVEVDVSLSTGAMSIEEATLYFEDRLNMSSAEAESEVLARLAAPGQGLSYVVGKIQLYEYQAKARLAAAAAAAAAATATATDAAAAHNTAHNGDDDKSTFNLASFHSLISYNGNLPFVLQMHDANLSTSLDTSFINLHFHFKGVPSSEIANVARDLSRVKNLPGAPPPTGDDALPVSFSGYADVGGAGGGEGEVRSLFYLMVHSTKQDVKESTDEEEFQVLEEAVGRPEF